MKPYLIIYEHGNGYHCQCCRSVTNATETMEFENDEAAKNFAVEYNKNNEKQDNRVENIFALENINPVV